MIRFDYIQKVRFEQGWKQAKEISGRKAFRKERIGRASVSKMRVYLVCFCNSKEVSVDGEM